MISIIIPLYNAEKFIAQCLDSVRRQTFTDYEVIVIDDCSTDRSVAIVEEIAQKFDGRLRLIKREKNSGGAARPRNIGINLARGDYIFFLDGDDVITRDALKILDRSARSFDADVVHVEKYFVTDGDAIEPQSKLRIDTHQSAPFVDKPTLETDDLAQRVARFCRKGYMWWGCSKLFRRDFLIENELKFLAIPSTEDMIFTFETMCLSERLVRIPDIVYIYRQTKNSATRAVDIDIEEQLNRFARIISTGTRELERFMSGLKFFEEHPEYRYAALNFFVQSNVSWESWIYTKAPAFKLDALLKKNFAAELEHNSAMAAQLLNMICVCRGHLARIRLQLGGKKF